jgi:hypothetical protein
MCLPEPQCAFYPQQVQEVELDDERQLRPGFAVSAQVATDAPHPIGYVAGCLHRGPTRAAALRSQCRQFSVLPHRQQILGTQSGVPYS